MCCSSRHAARTCRHRIMQDEVYVVTSGRGRFRRADEVVDFATGDLLFVPAKVPHQFEDFSDDLTAWVIFFGPRKN